MDSLMIDTSGLYYKNVIAFATIEDAVDWINAKHKYKVLAAWRFDSRSGQLTFDTYTEKARRHLRLQR